MNYHDDPIFFTPPCDPLGRCGNYRSGPLYKGGGGGTKNYKNLEKLYGEQAESARLLRQMAEKNLPGAVDSYVKSSQEFLGPEYVERQIGNVQADMASANAMEREAATRNLASMGVNPSDPRFAGTLRSVETSNAARMAAGSNTVRDQAKLMQNSVAKDMVGTFTGQSNMASQQTAQAGSGLANLAAQQQQAQINKQTQQANAVGSVVGGGIAAYNTFFKDGGRVRAPRGIPMLANGGFLTPAAPTAPPPPVAQQRQASPLEAGMQMHSMVKAGRGAAGRGAGSNNAAAKFLSKINRGVGMDYQTSQAARSMTPGQQSAAAQAYRDAAAEAIDPAARADFLRAADGLDPTGQAAAPVRDASVKSAAQINDPNASLLQADPSAAQVSPVNMTGEVVTSAEPTMSLVNGGTEAAGSMAKFGAPVAEAAAGAEAAAAAEAAALASAEFGASGAALGSAGAGAGAAAGSTAGALGGVLSAVGTALPWIGAAAAVGSLLGLFKDGGGVESGSQDLRDGGAVSGPGGHTDDLVPALLSDMENVDNAEATALIGQGKLDRINKIGLRLRARGIHPNEIRSVAAAGSD